MTWIEYLLVFALGVLAGGWAIPAGIFLELDPLGVYLAALAGSLAWSLVFLWLISRFRSSLIARHFPDAEERVRSSKATQIMERFGVPGLALVGGLVLGPTLTLLAAAVTGADMTRFRIWWIVSAIGGFALLTVFWVAVGGMRAKP